MFEDMIRRIQICIPFGLLREKYLSLILEHRINPEIGINSEAIDTHTKRDFEKMAAIIRQEGLSITIHGPYHDLVPGGMDKNMLRASRERLKEAFDIIPLFEPMSVVCHTGYDRKRYYDAEDAWLDTALETWAPLVKDLEGTGTIFVLENVYEKTPGMLLKLIKGLDSEMVGCCLDTGHMNVFSETSMDDWLKVLGPFLKELHLHDNDGTWDDHLAIGAGEIDFEDLFAYIEGNGLRPIMTLEAHKEKWIWQSLEALSSSECFCRIRSRSPVDRVLA